MPQLGQQVTYEEEQRIGELSAEERQAEIAALVESASAAGASETACQRLRAVLENLYEHPERYARFPDAASMEAWNPEPLPYHGLRR